MADIIKALQHIYTSSHHGGGGFHTLAYSDGLTRDEIHTLEELITYPIDLGLELSKKESPPEIYRYLKIDDKHSVCSKSVFVPKDFAGRPGNYFSHSLVFNINELINPFPVFTQPDIFLSKYDKDTFRLPPLEIELKEETRSFLQPLPDEIFNQFTLILEAIINTFKKKSSVFIIAEQTDDIFSILSNIFRLLPPWLKTDMTFTTLTLNPVRESTNYRLMFSLSKYNPQMPPSDNSNIITFDFTNKNIPKIEITSAWVKLISRYLKNNEIEKATKLVDLHRQHGKKNPSEMAEILAELTIYEEEFYQKQDASCLPCLNMILSIQDSKTKIEVLQHRIENLIKILLERNSYGEYLNVLNLLNKQPELEIHKIFLSYLEILITNPEFLSMFASVEVGIDFIIKLVPFAPKSEKLKNFVFESVGNLIEKNPVDSARVFKDRFHLLLTQPDSGIFLIMEELFIYLVKRLKEKVEAAQYIFEIFSGSKILINKSDAILDILTCGFNVEVFTAWINALLMFLTDNEKIKVIERTICQCIDKCTEYFMPRQLNELLSPLPLSTCESILKNVEKFYDKGRKLKPPSTRSFLFFGKKSQTEKTKSEEIYDKLIGTVREIVLKKRVKR